MNQPTVRLSDRLYLDRTTGEYRETPDGASAPLLTCQQVKLFSYFLEHTGQVLTRDQLCAFFYDRADYGLDRQIDKMVSSIRKKIAAAAPGCDPLRTIRGIGYQCEVPREAFLDRSEQPEDLKNLMNEALLARVNNDHPNYIRLIRECAAKNHPRAVNILGVEHMNGRYIPQDLARGFSCYCKAADAGCAQAQFNLGYIFFFGVLGQDCDPERAVKYFTLASENPIMPDGDAMYHLYLAYHSGRGVPADPEKAMYWKKQAKERGITSSTNYYDLTFPEVDKILAEIQ